MAPRTATYRLQLTPQFGFDAAASLADYLARLGVSHLYASPYLQAAEGSSHGYDVVDPGQINHELGGETGRTEMCAALKQAGLAHIVDIVPNHMAIRGGHNAWWWDVLENGPASRYSRYFDVEWHPESDDKVLLPVLGDQYGVELEAGRILLTRDGGNFLMTYFEHRAPVAPRALSPLLRSAAERSGSEQLAFIADALEALPLPNAMDGDSRARRHRGKEVLMGWIESLLAESKELARDVDATIGMVNADTEQLHSLLEAQNYRFAYWRVGNHELAYRRFFDIDSLVGLRVEDDEVFSATHRLILQWLSEGSIDGVRIDHVDGLYDPEAYLRRIRALAPNAWLLVEKILEGEERLSPGWPVEGTTGYEFLNHVQRVLIDGRGEGPLSSLADQLSREPIEFEDLVRSCKDMVLREALDSDLQRLVERLSRIIQSFRRHRDTARVELAHALRELIIAWPVYRTYTSPGEREISERDRSIVEAACAAASEQRTDLDPRLFDLLKRLLLLEYRDSDAVDFVMRFQQLSGPAMAKGLEDTAFYRHHRLVALNEVGGDPNHFHESPAEFHRFMQERAAMAPHALSASSTHDTKRSEDVRARLLVLSEIPDEWGSSLAHFRGKLAEHKTWLESDEPLEAPDSDTEHFVWQNLIGAWPLSEERVQQFATKAVREAKRYSSWHRPHDGYEGALRSYITAIYEDKELCGDIDGFVAHIRDAGFRNSLSQLTCKMLCPGVPDIYQGTELWDFSLVDPDNRRPVDFEQRKTMLAELPDESIESLWETRIDGRVKLHVTTELLHLRRRHLSEETPGYDVLGAAGSAEHRVVAWSRGSQVAAVVTRFWQREGDMPPDTTVSLPPGTWTNVLTRSKGFSGTVPLVELLGPLPVAGLEREAGQ